MELQVEGRNLDIKKTWHEKIEDEKQRLIRQHPGLVHNLRVTIEGTKSHKEGGYSLSLVAQIPNDTVVVKRKGEGVKPLLVEAFDTLGLQLKEVQRKRRQVHKVVVEEVPVGAIHEGTIKKVVPYEEYGFIATPDGREIYFHANALKDGTLDQLKEGDEVRFGEADGDKGPQANWVKRSKA